VAGAEFRHHRLAMAAGVVVLLLFLGLQVWRTGTDVRNAYRSGVGGRAAVVGDIASEDASPTMVATTRLPASARVVSNGAHAIWALTGREPVTFAVGATYLVETASWVACGSVPTYLVWFDAHAYSRDERISDAETDLMTPIEKLSDGAIYQVAPDPARCAAQ
jgi:hypothetical protein